MHLNRVLKKYMEITDPEEQGNGESCVDCNIVHNLCFYIELLGSLNQRNMRWARQVAHMGEAGYSHINLA